MSFFSLWRTDSADEYPMDTIPRDADGANPWDHPPPPAEMNMDASDTEVPPPITTVSVPVSVPTPADGNRFLPHEDIHVDELTDNVSFPPHRGCAPMDTPPIMSVPVPADDNVSRAPQLEDISSLGLSIPGSFVAQGIDNGNPWKSLVRPSPSETDSWQSNKVLVREADFSESVRDKFYNIKSRLHRTMNQLQDAKAEKQTVIQATSRQFQYSRAEQSATLQGLYDDLAVKDTKIAEQDTRMKNELAERDRTIAVQTHKLKNLEKKMNTIAQQSVQQTASLIADRDTVIADQTSALKNLQREHEELMKRVGRLAANKEAELATLLQRQQIMVDKFEQLQSQQSQPRSHPSTSNHPSSCETPGFATYKPVASRIRLSGKHPTDNCSTSPSATSHSASKHTEPANANIQAITQKVYEMLAKDLPAMQTATTSTTFSRPKRISRKVQQLKHELAISRNERNSNLDHVRELFNEVFSISKDEDFLLVEGASKEEVSAFAETGQRGPDPSDLRWDFNHPASSFWNQAVIHLLLCKLVEMRVENQWKTQPRSNVYWEDAITEKFKRIRSQVAKAQPRVQVDLTVENEVEIAERLSKTKEQLLKKGRRDSRRMAKYKRRLQVTRNASALAKERGESDELQVWEFLNMIITRLGSDGTSSDESDMEDMEPIFRKRLMFWRRDISDELEIIDKACSRDSDILSPRGAKATKRIQGCSSSSRKEVKDLPREFYNLSWLMQKESVASGEVFPWTTIVQEILYL